jgi:low temperature requirement protein LtrA
MARERRLMAEQVTAAPDVRASSAGPPTHLREHDERAGEVRPIELFFDLVYVLAVTQLTRHLVANLTLRGALETLILLLAVWGAWNHIAWITNYFDLDARAARLVLIGLMLASLIMSSSLYGAFEDHGPHAAAACLILGGPALFLVGQALFKSAVWGRVPLSRLAPISAVLTLIPVAVVSTVVVLLSLATAVVAAAAWWSSRAHAGAARTA